MKTIRFEDVSINTIFHYDSAKYGVLEYMKIISYDINNAVCISGELKGKLDRFYSGVPVLINTTVCTYDEIIVNNYFRYKNDIFRKLFDNASFTFPAFNITKQKTEYFSCNQAVILIEDIEITTKTKPQNLLTEEWMVKHGITNKTIKFIKRNGLIDFPLNKLHLIRGDFKNIISEIKYKSNIPDCNYEYDNNGNLISITDVQMKRLLKYNNGNLVYLSYTDSNSPGTEYRYDSNHNIISRKSGCMDCTAYYEYKYDDKGNIKEEKVNHDTTIYYDYFESGNLYREKNIMFENLYSYTFIKNKLREVYANNKLILEIPEF